MGKEMSYKRRLGRILGMSDWSRDKLADLLGVSNNTLDAWLGGRSEPKPSHAERVDAIYNELVAPVQCQIDHVADAVEKRILQERIKHLPDDNSCDV